MERTPSRLLVAALAATLTLGLLAACTSEKDTGGGADQGSKPSKSSAPVATADPAKNGANEMGVDQPDLSKVLISKQFTLPSDARHKVTVGILSLERKDQVAVLKVVVSPDFADMSPTQTIDFTKALDQSGFHFTPTMLDLKNLKKYTVLYQDGKWLNYSSGEAVSGQPIYGWAVFAAPPAGVTSVDVTVTDWMPRFTNVPVG